MLLVEGLLTSLTGAVLAALVSVPAVRHYFALGHDHDKSDRAFMDGATVAAFLGSFLEDATRRSRTGEAFAAINAAWTKIDSRSV